jgi:glycosyltransferase involved in cell wall biosynthesis
VHVGLNLIFLVPREMSGLETYARELTGALLQEEPNLRVTAFVSREASADETWRELVPTVTVPVYGRRRAAWVRGEQLMLPRLAQEAGVDVVHSLASTAPSRGSFARVVTIHDLIYRIHPDAHGWRSFALRLLIPLAARRSHRIIAPSETTRHDLVELLHVEAEKIDVVPNGIGTSLAARWEPEDELRRRYDLGDAPLVLSVSARRPHKNLVRLLEAFARVEHERAPLLVLPGYRTAFESEVADAIERLGLTARVRTLGWVPDEDLEGLYLAACCFVFPSLAEGFGQPVLEAMERGVAVASSNASSLPEVGGDSVLYFDPLDVAAIAEAIQRLLTDRELAERLAPAGRARAREFSWARTAHETIGVYRRAFHEHAGRR